MYKAIVSDFDNTIADLETHSINHEVKENIRKLVQTGVIFSLVTGKPFSGIIENACNELGLHNLQIVHGGAEIINPLTKEIVWGRYISNDITKEIISYLKTNNIFFAVEKENKVYTPSSTRLKFYGETMKYEHIDSLIISHIPKIVVPATINKFTEKQVEEIITHMQTLYKDVHIVKGGIHEYFGFDITHMQASKHTAVLEFMKLMHLKKEEVIGVGDGYNDYPLLSACGQKVAMGDAPEELKTIADFIAPTQKENGMVDVLRRYF